MSGKLDQPLQDIVSSARKGGNRRSQRRNAGRPAAAAPVGGIQKAKGGRNANAKTTPGKAGAPQGESKVIVSNLVSQGALRNVRRSR